MLLKTFFKGLSSLIWRGDLTLITIFNNHKKSINRKEEPKFINNTEKNSENHP